MTTNGTMVYSSTTSPGTDVEDILGDPLAGDILLEDMTPNEKIVVMVMLAAMAVVGTVGNALAIYVFARLKQKLTSTIFILTLAGTDFITCLITIPFTIIMEHLRYYVDNEFVCKAYHFLITTTVPFSCVVIVAIAIDRYMCICHPFHHWMNIRRARIIVFIMGVCIFIIGGIVAAHYKTTKVVSFNYPKNVTFSTIQPGPARGGGGGVAFEFNSTSPHDGGGIILTSLGPDHAFTAYPYSPGPSYSQEPGRPVMSLNRTDLVYTPPASGGRGYAEGGSDRDSTSVITKTEERHAVVSAMVDSKCMVDTGTIHDEFFRYFHKMYISIFILSCFIVLALYSLIYRSVIAQRKKKLRIKSAQCCLLWNATSVEAPPPEALEMTQDIELSHVNGGEDRFAGRQHSGAGATAEELEAAIGDGGAGGGGSSAPAHNNGSSTASVVRKSSLSNARIERMRVANIKTAGTLFVVTIVFIIAFLPAWLMASGVLNMNVIVFYMYFVYNVVNPFIYAFLNQNFKTELKRIFHCR